MNQDDNSNKIGVVAATLMVAGNMMGSGVFMLPANLAAIGGVAVFGWIVTCIGAIGMTLNFTLWAFIGVESASVSAGVVKNPKKNVPIATIGGVILAAVCYVLSSSVIMGMIPNHALANSSAPFADAARLAFGEIAGNGGAIWAALGCLGLLAG